jgi:hypothetical protein
MERTNMSTVFEPMTPTEQGRFRAAYLAYLRERDGVPDMETQRFDVRERFFADLDAAPNCWDGKPPLDQAVFDRNHARHHPEPNLDEVMLWAIATAKTNRSERYGVEYALAYRDRTRNAANDPHAYIQIEEFYHTRILRDALATLGLRMEMGRPGFSARTMIRAMVRLPENYANVLVLCGEICGVAVFSLLLEKARELFANQPAVLARHEALFGQIMVDEVGHVHFVRSTLSPRRLAWARRILPLVAWGLLDESPEVLLLFGREQIMRRIVAADVDAAAAPYPDRFTFFASPLLA